MTKAEREKAKLEGMLRGVRAYLPSSGTVFESYTFLASESLWTGKIRSQLFVAVAEDRWNDSGSGWFLAELYLDGMFVVDLKKRTVVNYCASSFSNFIKIMDLYQMTVKNTPAPESVRDDEGYRRCKEAAEILRKQVTEIDPTALSRDSYFWNTRIEEFGAGIIL